MYCIWITFFEIFTLHGFDIHKFSHFDYQKLQLEYSHWSFYMTHFLDMKWKNRPVTNFLRTWILNYRQMHWESLFSIKKSSCINNIDFPMRENRYYALFLFFKNWSLSFTSHMTDMRHQIWPHECNAFFFNLCEIQAGSYFKKKAVTGWFFHFIDFLTSPYKFSYMNWRRPISILRQ